MNYSARATTDTVAFEQTWAEDPKTESRSRSAPQLSSGLWRTAFLTLAGLALSALAVNEVVDWTLRKEIHEKQLAAPNALLTAIRAEEASRLSQYRWVRKSDGIVRVPILRAKQLVIQDYAQTQGKTLLQPSSNGGKQ